MNVHKRIRSLPVGKVKNNFVNCIAVIIYKYYIHTYEIEAVINSWHVSYQTCAYYWVRSQTRIGLLLSSRGSVRSHCNGVVARDFLHPIAACQTRASYPSRQSRSDGKCSCWLAWRRSVCLSPLSGKRGAVESSTESSSRHLPVGWSLPADSGDRKCSHRIGRWQSASDGTPGRRSSRGYCRRCCLWNSPIRNAMTG